VVLKLGLRIALLAGFILAAGWSWRVIFPGDEALIRRQLLQLARTTSFGPDEAPLTRMANAAKVANFFAVDTDLDFDIWNYGRVKISSRDEVRQAATGARQLVTALTVNVSDVEIIGKPTGDTAIARFTLSASTGPGTDRPSQQMEFEFRKAGGTWLIQRGKVFDYLSH